VDDEMSSSEEESGEIAEELAVSQSKSQNKQDIVDLTQSGRQVDMIDLTDKDMLSDLDRADAGDLIDLTSSTRAASADMQGETESQEDTRIIQATAKILDDIDDNESNREASDMTSPSPEHSVAGPDSDGFSSDLETNSTDSDVDMDDDHSDDDEDIDGDSDDEKENWDAEYSSDDDVLDEGNLALLKIYGSQAQSLTSHYPTEDPDTAVWPRPETQPADNTVFTQHGSNGVEHNPVFGNDETLDFGTPHNAGIAHPAAFAGPYPVPYYPMSNSPSMFQSQPTLPSLCEPPVSHQARPSSPSDAALPKRSVPPTLPNLSYPSAESLGEATGKQEFFAARAENKRRVFAPSLYRRLESPVRFVPCTMPRVDHAKQAEIDNSKNVDMASEEHHVAPAQTPVATPGFVAVAAAEESQQPAEPVLASVPQSSAANPTVVITPLLQKGDDFLNDARSAFNIRLPAFSGDDLGEPISAFDLQQRKVAAKKKADLHLKKLDQDQHELWLAETRRDEGRNPTTECGHSSRRTHVGISDLVEAQKPEEPAQAPVAGKGKRKAAEMAELTETEIQWEAAETNLMGHLRAAHESLVQAPLEQNHFRLANVQEGRVLTMSSHVESSTDRRTPKRLRLRKIAERLGYAALGGATVGAALVSTLIYTAPTFT
jgi:hypothetical protein